MGFSGGQLKGRLMQLVHEVPTNRNIDLSVYHCSHRN